jgi:hypothetical protein
MLAALFGSEAAGGWGNVMSIFYAWSIGFLIIAGGWLLYNLGAGRVPQPIRPIGNMWVRAGYNPKWINVAMWTLFALIAATFLLFVARPLYTVVVDLGTTRR